MGTMNGPTGPPRSYSLSKLKMKGNSMKNPHSLDNNCKLGIFPFEGRQTVNR